MRLLRGGTFERLNPPRAIRMSSATTQQQGTPKLQDEALTGVAQFAYSAAFQAFMKERSSDRAAKLLRKLRAVASSQAKESGAETGPTGECHGLFKVTVPEAIAIAAWLRESLPPAELSAFQERLRAHVKAVEPFTGRREASANLECPLLHQGRCIAGDMRPLACRCETAGASAAAENAARAGLEAGLADAGLYPGRVEVGRAVLLALEVPDVVQDFFNGGNQIARPPSAAPAPEPPQRAGEPIGRLVDPPRDVRQFFALRFKGEHREALSQLKGDDTLRSLLRFAVPPAYGSQDDLEGWASYIDQHLSRLEAMEIEPAVAFDALDSLVTFELAYQAKNLRPLMSRFGDLVFSWIVAPLFPDLAAPLDKRRSGPLRVGYISTHLRAHHGAAWALGWAESHDPEMQTYAFHLGEALDHRTETWAQTVDHFYHLPGSVPQAARLIRGLEMDALIFTDIGMNGRDLQFAALRLAPVQCTAWGHPVTSGLPTVDYYLSSEMMEPDNGDEHYREKLVRLPNSGLRYPMMFAEQQNRTRAHFGLPDGFLPIMCQNLMKCVPQWDFLFREINEATGSPIVFLHRERPDEAERITRERLDMAGVRSIWVPYQTTPEFIKLISLCDVSLDPPAWNGGNTTVQALSVGTPVVTMLGEFMRGRHSVAFLKMAGLEELIARTPEEYVKLASNKERLRSAMEKANPRALFLDPKPVEALDMFFARACRE